MFHGFFSSPVCISILELGTKLVDENKRRREDVLDLPYRPMRVNWLFFNLHERPNTDECKLEDCSNTLRSLMTNTFNITYTNERHNSG